MCMHTSDQTNIIMIRARNLRGSKKKDEKVD